MKKTTTITKDIITIFMLIIILSLNSILKAQDEVTKHFIGINPSITAEPFYEKGEVDINIFPLVYQRILINRVHLRLTSILNLGIRNDGNSLSIYGIEMAIPYYFSQKVNKYNPSRGLFIAPTLSFVRYSKQEHSNIGIWFESGYNILIDKSLSLSLGLQFGATYFSYDNDANKWRNHFGIKIVLGKWL
jgi:hypothetical protein